MKLNKFLDFINLFQVPTDNAAHDIKLSMLSNLTTNNKTKKNYVISVRRQLATITKGRKIKTLSL